MRGRCPNPERVLSGAPRWGLGPLDWIEQEQGGHRQECCNGVGYNPLKYVCSDKISTGMMMKVIDRKPLRGTDLTMEREIQCS